MQLHYIFTSCLLVKSVYILGDNRLKLTCFFKLGELDMCLIRLCVKAYHLFSVKLIELLGMGKEISVTKKLFGRHIVFLIVNIVKPDREFSNLGI